MSNMESLYNIDSILFYENFGKEKGADISKKLEIDLRSIHLILNYRYLISSFG
jgi:hypothetical protein